MGMPGARDDATGPLEKALAAKPTDEFLVGLWRASISAPDISAKPKGADQPAEADPKDATLSAVLAPLYLATGRTVDARKGL